MVNVGIVGLGFMAATHIKAYRKIRQARVTAICNPSGRHLDGNLTKVGGNIGPKDPVRLDMRKVKAYRSFEQMRADPEIDLIDICAPTPAHSTLAIAALEAGKHVVCEKPLARTAKLAREIAKTAEEKQVFLMPAMCLRFWPEWAWLKEVVANETYGKVLAARFRRVAEPPSWGQKNFLDGERSGGALLDLHIHDTDFVQFCFGRPRAVFSIGFTKVSGAIDHVVTQYQVESGACVHAEGSWAMAEGFGFSMGYTAVFEEATADYDIARGKGPLKLFQKGKAPRTIRCPGQDGYAQELRYMIESIQNGTPPTLVTAEDGVSSVEICEAEEQSIRTGKVVWL
jgi:predicted dehydrogenase